MSNDLLQRISFNSGHVRGVGIKLETSYAALTRSHSYPTLIKLLLGEFSVAALMLRALTDFQGRLHIHARGSGHIQLLSVECDENFSFRGLAKFEGSSDSRELPLMLGDAQLAITTIPQKGPTYQGIVPLSANTLQQCIEDYFDQSEQIPTRLWLASNNDISAGFLIQKLPTQQSDDLDEWNRLVHLGNTIRSEELLGLSIDDWLTRLFHQEEVRIHATRVPAFSCRCARKRFLDTLKTLPTEEIDQLLDEQGSIEVECEFCQASFAFYASDFE